MGPSTLALCRGSLNCFREQVEPAWAPKWGVAIGQPGLMQIEPQHAGDGFACLRRLR